MITCGDLGAPPLVRLLRSYGLDLGWVEPGTSIPGSYWGAPEAGLQEDRVFVRGDTPVHSLLHEACHAICMGPRRRAVLDTDAGGDDAEEAAVCYLQLVLAERLVGVGRDRLATDMDRWGYSFRLGSTRAWFESDAEDARSWLIARRLLSPAGGPLLPVVPVVPGR